MAYPDMQIGSQPVMTIQPSHMVVRVRTLRRMTRLADGSYVGSNRDAGRVVMSTFGVEAAAMGAYDELLADLAAENDVFTIAGEDPNGNAISIPVVAERIDREFGPAQLYGPFTVSFFETAA